MESKSSLVFLVEPSNPSVLIPSVQVILLTVNTKNVDEEKSDKLYSSGHP